jgi:hypothetical protein
MLASPYRMDMHVSHVLAQNPYLSAEDLFVSTDVQIKHKTNCRIVRVFDNDTLEVETLTGSIKEIVLIEHFSFY